MLGAVNAEQFLISENKKTGEVYDPPYLNWETEIKWDVEENRDALDPMFLPENERYYRKKEIDTRKLFYEYYFIDLQAASRKDYTQPGDSKNANFANRPQGMKDRSVYVRKESINVYPDTLAWLHDYAYSYNDPVAQRYFWHPAYDNYPVVGVNWKQASAFCIWRSRLLESFLQKKKSAVPNEFRLPTEAEWEWAARGGNTFSPYPWGGPYTRNDKGCFLANFKPLRGNYIDDGGARSVIVAHYPANDFGLYDMSGNVAEWCADAYNESASQFTWDMNPTYLYNAKEDDVPLLKQKVIRGGSWKDIAYYIQVSTRAYEYQDSSKCYIGFRCVQDFMGRQKDDNPARASRIYN
jgi:gliding motility-associated lipoprotein GldK